MSEDSGLLAEHEGVQDDDQGQKGGYAPSDDERKTIKLVYDTFQRYKKHRKKYDSKWLDNYKFFRGKQWTEPRPSYRHSEVINMVFQDIQSVVPIMTDSRPKVEYVPTDPSDKELADILNEVFQSDWEKNNWQQELLATIYDSHFYGIGMGSMLYDPKAKDNAGEIVHESADPFYCYPDPNALDVNKKSKGFIYAEPIDIACAREEYPEHAKHFKADIEDLMGGDKTDLDEIRYRSPVEARTNLYTDEKPKDDKEGECLKITLWLKDGTSYEEEKTEVGEDGIEQKVYETKLKYPNGRRIVVIGGVLCSDAENPYEDRKFPYAKLVNYMLPREYYGISEIEQLEGPQKIFNKLVSFAMDVLTLMGNPIWVIDNDSQVDTENLFNSPGLVVEKQKGSEVRREEGVSLQPYVLQLIDRMKGWFDGISGASDVTRGVRPEGITAASAISELQEAAQTRIRLKSRNLDAYLQDFGQLWVSRCFQFKTAPQIFRITNDQNANKYFKFYVEPMVGPDGVPTGGKKAVLRGYNEDPETGKHVEEIQDKEFEIRGEFDVRVTTGSALPFAKAQKANLAFQMFDRGAIDALELLKSADWPNFEAVYQQVQERKQQEAMMAAQQQAAMAPPAAAPGMGA